ncbi:related to DNA damage response protein kinase DUN1 [Saccharomycodes ludwigii]|uniref:Related to DNA damage response protein kinase DUN1 n=1 Tax=Saccharomycodes ludwigii TaxID=36035 RepID=A0A376B7Y1_9ASCO|nr:hypothetical protein SCDLUD_002657 [Saccharomycodes ludwigii]KAH3901174.1 hypothetical protein SCDLUD_002657 [Saccharomycodes ludwigii]SSD60793.1 related to DNA damage response protein kinase DUN1 [Saccharomycodes ludwigii]
MNIKRKLDTNEVDQPILEPQQKKTFSIYKDHPEKLASLYNIIPGKEDEIYDIFSKNKTKIGRSRSCDIILHEPDISTVHCILYCIPSSADPTIKVLNIIDNKSRNSTYINGNKLVKRDYVLKNGDKIVMGKSCSFIFKYANVPINETEATNKKDSFFKAPQSINITSAQESGGSTSSGNRQVLAHKQIKQQRPISIFEKYIVGKELGSGHYAVVKEGKNKFTGEIVAVKIFHPQKTNDVKKMNQFRAETNILLNIKHNNIVRLLDRFVEPVTKSAVQTYLVLEKINDGELFDRIVKKTKLRQDETKAIFRQILGGLKYLHDNGIIHRDIKPENILLNIKKRCSLQEVQSGPWDEDEISITVKIADFGLAKFIGEMKFTNTLCGTPSYVAPEVLLKQNYSSKVDMWSAGVLLYVCLCGFPPFSEQLAPPTMKEQITNGIFQFYSPYWDDIEDSVLHLISNLLVVDPDKRFNVQQAVHHPWFNTLADDSFKVNRTKLSQEQQVPRTYSELSKLSA